MIKVLGKQETQRITLNQVLFQEVASSMTFGMRNTRPFKLNWNKVKQSHSSLSIKAEYKGGKDAFVGFMKDVFRGSRIRETTYGALSEEFSDFGAMFKAFDKAKAIVGTAAQTFETYFEDNLPEVTHRPGRFPIALSSNIAARS